MQTFKVAYSDTGFTMVELVTVIVILGILVALTFPLLGSVGEFQEQNSGDRVVSGFRYAQEQALSRNRFVKVTTSDTSGFRIRYCAVEATDPVSCPAGEWETLAVPRTGDAEWRLSGGLSFDSADTYYFDALGRSVKGDGSVAGERTLSLGGGAETIVVAGETGFARRP